MNRKEMLQDCPEDFKDRLEDIIDYIEGQVVEARESLNISSISDMDRITVAYDTIQELAENLY